ncbi:MAG: SpoIIE family protein phosphatase [Oscillospiraceae bacterium]|nr:SpoIIE family protein phosphatase [Oscillospiraceae bacterium]
MKKVGNIVIGGIQQKIFNLVLVTVLLMMAAYTAVVIYQAGALGKLMEETNESQKQSISAISRGTMDSVLDASFTESTQMQAYIANSFFGEAESVVRMLADYTEHLYADPGAYGLRAVSLPDKAKDGEISAQLLTEEGVDLSDPQLRAELGLVGNLADMMIALYRNANVDSCYIGLPSGVMLLVDDHAASKFDEDGKLMSIPIRERIWYTGAVEKGELYYTDVTKDHFTGQISVMCSLPVYHAGRLVAVIGADLFLNDMAAAVGGSVKDGSFVCVINENGHVVFSPQTVGIFQVRPDEQAQDLRESEDKELAEFVKTALKENTGVRTTEINGEGYYMAGSPITSVNWAVVGVVSREAMDQPTAMLESQYDNIQEAALNRFQSGLGRAKLMIIVLILIVFAIGASAALFVSKRIVKPLEAITRRVSSLGGDDLQFFVEKEFRTGDEIEVLAESFANLSAKTLRYVAEVKRVTAEKERIGAELQMATEIQASQLPRLFPPFPTRTEFDIFASMDPAKEVGGDFYDFYLVDDDHIALVMADVSGKGVPAALFMMVSRVLIKSRLQSGETPSEALKNVNNQLCEGNNAGFFVTVWLAVLEISTGKGIAANAGHEHPALRRANGPYELVTYRHSVAVAAMEDVPFKQHEFQLHPGDSVFVYTDGVAEATNENKELFGTDRMLAALNKDPDAIPQQVLKNVQEAIDSFVAGAEQFDDITMLCLKYNGPKKRGT